MSQTATNGQDVSVQSFQGGNPGGREGLKHKHRGRKTQSPLVLWAPLPSGNRRLSSPPSSISAKGFHGGALTWATNIPWDLQTTRWVHSCSPVSLLPALPASFHFRSSLAHSRTLSAGVRTQGVVERFRLEKGGLTET